MLKIFTIKYEEKSESFNDISMSNFLADNSLNAKTDTSGLWSNISLAFPPRRKHSGNQKEAKTKVIKNCLQKMTGLCLRCSGNGGVNRARKKEYHLI